ncbi:MAG: glycosyltransferase family 9 protein [Candidatus Aminicenantes bacterium]|nr:glycosyltransferase family 9 protein [Candidatus Aminicenantes bacterium]
MRILIVKLSSLGDVIHTIPAFSCIRKNKKEDYIGWMVSNKARELVQMIEGVDEIVSPKKPGKWDIAIDFQGLVKTAFLSFFSSRIRYGFSKKFSRESWASLFYTHKLEDFKGTHVIKKNLALSSLFLGTNCEEIKFPLKLKTFHELEPLFKGKIIINAGASWRNKRIPLHKIIEIAEKLSSKGLSSVVLWGSEDEKKIAEKAAEQNKSLLLSPYLSLKQVMYAISISSMVISGDSFPLHAASALGIPAIGVFGPTDPERNGPLDPSRVITPSLKCHPCWKRKCNEPLCMLNINTDEIVEKALELLSMSTS